MRKKISALLVSILLLAFGRHRSQSMGKELNTKYQKILALSIGGTMGLAWQLATLKKYEDRGMIDHLDKVSLILSQIYLLKREKLILWIIRWLIINRKFRFS